MPVGLPINRKRIAEFCQRWRIHEFSFFGSVLRQDFGADSDVDALVSFEPNARWSLIDVVRMQDELGALLGRKVDIVEKRALRNPYLRHRILTTREVIYAA